MAGSALTSLAMMLNGYGLLVEGEQIFPDNLNTWMKHHGGFVSSDVVV